MTNYDWVTGKPIYPFMPYQINSKTEKELAALQCFLRPQRRGIKIGGGPEFPYIAALWKIPTESPLFANHFIVGDLLGYIDDALHDWKKRAAEMTGLTPNDPSKWATTCRRIKLEERTFNCKWTHYETVGTAKFLSPDARLALLSKYESEPLQKLKAEVKSLNPTPPRRVG